MKILILSYGDINYDGRLKGLVDTFNNLGEVTCLCKGINQGLNKEIKFIDISENRISNLSLYLSFIYKSLQEAMKLKKIDILVVDNFFAAIPALMIRKLFRPTYTVQDVRELYFVSDLKKIKEKILISTEILLMKKADIVLCANEHRSKIMVDKYDLKIEPVVYENIRFLEYTDPKIDYKDKYNGLFDNKITLIATGGISVSRGTDRLVESMKSLPDNYQLIIVGSGTNSDRERIFEIINEYDLKNIILIEKVPMDELKFLVKESTIGVVHYHERDLNNRYCASGKIYEYLNEGLPIICSTNPPLKYLCEKYSIGISSNDYKQSVQTVMNNHESYKENVKKFIEDISPEEYNLKISEYIYNSLLKKDELIAEN